MAGVALHFMCAIFFHWTGKTLHENALKRKSFEMSKLMRYFVVVFFFCSVCVLVLFIRTVVAIYTFPSNFDLSASLWRSQKYFNTKTSYKQTT